MILHASQQSLTSPLLTTERFTLTLWLYTLAVIWKHSVQWPLFINAKINKRLK
jgi:hypothetical protein